jgi:hypothetical protein
MNRKLHETFAMFEARLDLTLFLTEPTGRTLRLLSCHHSVGGLHLANLALSFARLRSDKSQVKPLRQQIPCRLIVVPVPALCSPHVCHAGQIERPGA